MTGWSRVVLGIALVATVTPVMALAQAIALKTGFAGEQRLPRLWHRMVLRTLGIRVHLSGAPETARPLLIVSNHVSWTDILVLGSVADVHFVAKSDMARWPVFGALARLQRTVFVERDRRHGSRKQAAELAGRLGRGDALVLFPEGTTSNGNAVLPFKSTLFGAVGTAFAGDGAVAAVVQPAAISYNRIGGLPAGRRERARLAWIGEDDLLPHIVMLLRLGDVEAHLSFGEPIALDGESDRKRLAREAEKAVRELVTKSRRTT